MHQVFLLKEVVSFLFEKSILILLLQQSKSDGIRESISTAFTGVTSESEKEAQLIYAELDFDNVPPCPDNSLIKRSEPNSLKRRGEGPFCNIYCADDDDDEVIYSELAPCQKLPPGFFEERKM